MECGTLYEKFVGGQNEFLRIWYRESKGWLSLDGLAKGFGELLGRFGEEMRVCGRENLRKSKEGARAVLGKWFFQFPDVAKENYSDDAFLGAQKLQYAGFIDYYSDQCKGSGAGRIFFWAENK